MYLSQIAKYICLKLRIVFVSSCKMNLSQIAKYICPFLPFVSSDHLINAGYTMDNRVTHSQTKIPLIDTAASLILAILATKDKTSQFVDVSQVVLFENSATYLCAQKGVIRNNVMMTSGETVEYSIVIDDRVI